ncbi:MAG: hypothetical protein K2W94_07955 [Alphaproteobacteria bacterium]|nr:hypothetical protein [Alphaproteobacteria bacterium]
MHSLVSRKLISFCLVAFLSCLSVYASDDSDDDSLDGLTDQLTSKAKLSKDLTLCRSRGGEVVARHADTLQLCKGCSLTLKRADSKKQASKVAELSKRDGWTSHVTVDSVYVYEMDEESYSENRRPFTTGLGFPGVSSTKDVVVDWASNKSTQTFSNHYKRTSTGHSEPQVVEDFNALWTKDSASVVRQFIPQTEKEKSKAESVVMCGIELYGPFDMCDECLAKLVEFRAEHQKGQKSVSKAVRDKLKGKFKGDDEDAFVVAYHGYYPYHESTYSAEDNDEVFPLTYSRSKTGPRKDIFEHKSNDIGDISTLSQAKSLDTSKDMVYSQVHLLSGRKASLGSGKRTFVF